MSLRRPPSHALPNGLLWKSGRTGQLRAGEPIAEWAYQTPMHLQGLTRSALRRIFPAEQAELAEYWFRLNFVPFEADQPWFALNVSILNGPDLLTPEHASPLIFLEEEFLGVLPSDVVANLASQLLNESPEWSPVPPDAFVSPTDSAAVARAALRRVEADLASVGFGHNRGPALDPAIVSEIRDAVQVGLEALSAGSAGRDTANSAASRLGAAAKLGSAFVLGVITKVGEDAEPFIRHNLVLLFDHMVQAASALLQWAGSLPPGPLL